MRHEVGLAATPRVGDTLEVAGKGNRLISGVRCGRPAHLQRQRIMESIPQRLKPDYFCRLFGTTEAVP